MSQPILYKKLLAPVIFMVSVFYSFGSIQAFACSCSMGSVKEKYKSSFSVFTGKVKKIDYLQSANAFGDQNIIVYFEAPVIYKGESTAALHTAHNGTGCTGYWFKENEEYLIYTFERADGKLDTMWCGGVISKSESEKEFTQEENKLKKLAN